MAEIRLTSTVMNNPLLEPIQGSNSSDSCDEEDCLILLKHLQNDHPRVMLFFHAVGLIWALAPSATHNTQSWFLILLFRFNYIFVRCALILEMVFLIYLIDFAVKADYATAFFCVYSASIFIQILFILPAIVFIRQRLFIKVKHKSDVKYYEVGLNKSLFFFATSMIAIVMYAIVVNYYYGDSSYFGVDNAFDSTSLFFSQFALVCFLTPCLIFIIADTKISRDSVRRLKSWAENRTLTLKSFEVTRKEIADRGMLLFWTNTSVIVIAIANVVAAILLYYLNSIWSTPHLIFLSALVYFKDLMFLVTAFYHTANVNEQANDLSHFLAGKSWMDKDENDDVEAENSRKRMLADGQRLSIFIAALDAPIAFRLVGMRLVKRDVYLQILGLIISALGSILNRIVRLSK